MKTGKIIPNGVFLEPHEYKTVLLLTEQGWDVELMPPVRTKGSKTPDVKIAGEFWEIKSPKSESKYAMERAIRSAAKQSENIIVDLRRSKAHQQKCITRLRYELKRRKSIKKLRIITKTGQVIDIQSSG